MNARCHGSVSLALGLLFCGACSEDDASMDRIGDIKDAGGGVEDVGLEVPHDARKRIFFFRNGTLGKIRDSADTRSAVDVADEDCSGERTSGRSPVCKFSRAMDL